MRLSRICGTKARVRGTGTLLPSALLALGACEPQPPEGTGGVLVDESFGISGRSCGRGIAVGMADPDDYQSTNVALLGLDGATLSASFISSASADPSLNAALSGDVVFPSSRMTGDIVLIDRLVNSVLTFVDVETSEVTRQIAVRTGFQSNPQDYVLLDDGTALVSRLETNRNAGAEPFDGGDDLLRLDVDSGEIVERIGLEEFQSESTSRARPSRMVRTRELVLVSLTRHSADFQEIDEAALVILDAESGQPLDVVPVPGLANCGGLALSSDHRYLAATCGGLVRSSNGARPESSGLVVWSLGSAASVFELTEVYRLYAADLGYGPFAPRVTFAHESSVWFGTYGALEGDDAGRPDRIVAVDFTSDERKVLLESSERAFTLGGVLCVAPCGACFVADAGRGVVHRYPIAGTAIGEPTARRVENEIGLPPLFLGWF